MLTTSGSSRTARKREREPERGDDSPSKRQQRTKGDREPRYPSFYTSVRVLLDIGMAEITKCCIDSGFSSSGRDGLINPSIVKQLGLTTYPSYSPYRLADGTQGSHEYAVRLQLTFETQSRTVTIRTKLHVNQKDSESWSILLGTGVLNALGIMQNHQSNPSKCFIINRLNGSLEELHSDAPSLNPCATWFPKHDDSYLLRFLNIPSFLARGHREFPRPAWSKIGTSRELHAFAVLLLNSGRTFDPRVAANLGHLIRSVAAQEREAFVSLLQKDKENGTQGSISELNRAVDEEFGRPPDGTPHVS
ncbi:hypothetical protein CB0940_03038 [Cercospora beticola]|uniref:Uncharacterized protein n=1 Tax=Cercospora beticola TaxID=122368 RepID=A0A2G5I1W0_CERBT|nr:hypothetical protein CB0940_03038 [Cercospora beticola]PIA98738.1 hypothetical protein CB0940_03038 [Cercospora beticola]WPB00206.1 hypothetical protein RHO25_004825 [Cercospora beticola]CAK1361600.1 unnamed protein product [Cercospora beticola]